MTLEFALTEAQFAEVRDLLFGAEWHQPDDPERGFLAAVYPASGAERRTLILGEIIEPKAGEVYWSDSEGLIMTHQYYSRAIDVIQPIAGAGLINVHSHPGPKSSAAPPMPSEPDLDSDRRELGTVARALPAGRPVAAGIISAGGGISVREYLYRRPSNKQEAMQFEAEGPQIEFARRVRVVGPGFRWLHADPKKKISIKIDTEATDSSILLWGKEGQQLLAGLTVGIAGLGGVGGIVAEHLARLGVGRVVLVDYDRLNKDNFNRSQGATRDEAERQTPKVNVYSRVANLSATAPNFVVLPHRASVSEDEGLKYLLDCDFIVACADDAFARQVLDHASYSHLIPVIDGGTVLVADPKTTTVVAGKSQIATSGPGHPCLECQGVYSQEEATIARESPAWGRYLDLEGADEDVKDQLRAPSMISSNALVASLMGLRLMALALKTTPAALSGTQRYYIESGELCWAAKKNCTPECRKIAFTGLGDSHYIPTGIDLRWKKLQAEEAGSTEDPKEKEKRSSERNRKNNLRNRR
jgi:molybdopterin/thiamine biosynthesis adenylyltransferase